MLRSVGVEPTGERFNFTLLDAAHNRAFNPMVNSRAIVPASLLTCASAEHGAEEMRALFSRLAGRRLEIDEAVFRSEHETGHRNRANAWLMLNSGMVVPGQVMLAVYSPKLDRVGNSVRGIAVCRSFARDFGLHTCTSVLDPDSALRRFYGAREVACAPGPRVKYRRPLLGQRCGERAGRLPRLRNRSNPRDRRRVPATTIVFADIVGVTPARHGSTRASCCGEPRSSSLSAIFRRCTGLRRQRPSAMPR